MNISLTLYRKFKGSEWTLNGDDYAGLTWLSNSEKPTKETLENLYLEVKKEIEEENRLLEAEQTAKAEAKASALAKLTALGLNEKEVQALIS